MYIRENWTEELLRLMVAKMSERKEREAAAARGEGDILDATGPGAAALPGVDYTPKGA